MMKEDSKEMELHLMCLRHKHRLDICNLITLCPLGTLYQNSAYMDYLQKINREFCDSFSITDKDEFKTSVGDISVFNKSER